MMAASALRQLTLRLTRIPNLRHLSLRAAHWRRRELPLHACAAPILREARRSAAMSAAGADLPPAAAAAAAAAAPPPAEMPPALDADFDRAQFDRSVPVRALRVPARECHRYLRLLAPLLLNRPRVRNVADAPGGAPGAPPNKLLLLSETLDEAAAAAAPVPGDAAGLTLAALAARDGLALVAAAAALSYADLTAAEVLRALLPPGLDPPASFETVGHVAHLNLRPELLPHRCVVGAVLLDKNPRLRTVVTKTGDVGGAFRVYPMEILAGDGGTVTEVIQHGVRFRLDVATVYWNSRLEAEHRRLLERWLRPGDVLLDAMAGVGPFAVPAARAGHVVFANDLNPDSHRWLLENVRANRVAGLVSAHCEDARAFLAAATGGRLTPAPVPAPPPKAPRSKKGKGKTDGAADGAAGSSANGAPAPAPAPATALPPAAPAIDAAAHAPPFDHAIMNLPATAVEFLDALRGAFAPGHWAGRPLPMVHVYAFVHTSEGGPELQARIEKALGGPLDAPPEFFDVRDVSPSKRMWCASFRVPVAVAFAGQAGGGGGEAKRPRLEGEGAA